MKQNEGKNNNNITEKQNIQWFPGHMTRTRRKIESSLKLVDAVAEIIDARIPISSRNPELDKIIQKKPRIIILNKCDMADSKMTAQWISHYKANGINAIALDCKSGKGINNFAPAVRAMFADKIKLWESKGMVGRTLRVMVVGIPNVGKSSFINKLTKKSGAKAEDRPGVTRGNQWFTVDKSLDILDTPGVLWPKFDDRTTGEHLAFTGAVKDDVVDIELLCINLLELLKKAYPDALKTRYKLENTALDEIDSYELLNVIGKKRGMLISGGEIDTERAATMILDEFRAAKLGKITLEGVKDER